MLRRIFTANHPGAAFLRVLAVAALIGNPTRSPAGEPYRPKIDPAEFTHVVGNPFLPLRPGTTFVYSEDDRREKRENRIMVTRETRTIMGVKCVVVHDTVTLNGALVEESFSWFAQDRRGAVWFFGEATRGFKTGGRVSTAGSWEAGVNGAQPGIIMPATPKVGDRYRQEFLYSVAEDIGQVVGLGESVTVPCGTYTGCVRTREWSMLESGTSRKWYAKGVGLVRAESTDGEVSMLVSVTRK